MTVEEFWESKEVLAIHCDTFEKADKLLKKFDELGKKWYSGESYLIENYWDLFTKFVCYTNTRRCESKEYYEIGLKYKVIEFDDLEDFKEQQTNKYDEAFR